MSEAHRILDDVRAESERRWKAERSSGDLAHLTVLPPASAADHEQADAERDAEALAGELFDSRPILAHIAQSGRARRVAPLPVLGAVLARIAAFTTPDICVPPLVGGHAPLTLYPSIMDSTGGGKSGATACAADLLPVTPIGCIGPLALGTGEGLAELYLTTVEQEDDEGHKQRRRVQHRYGALLTLDEGRALADMGNRKGSTILPTLCTAWTGGDLGQANADAARFRYLPSGSYSLGLISAWQPAKAAALFDDTDGGLPGRMTYLPGLDHHAPNVAPDWPGPIHWTPPTSPWTAAVLGGLAPEPGCIPRRPLQYPTSALSEVDMARVAKLHGRSTVHPLDAHRNLHRLKIAGLLAQLEQRHEVTVGDWELTDILVRSSDLTRATVVDHIAVEAVRKEDAANARAARREAVICDTAERRALVSGARALANRAHSGTGGSFGRGELSRAASSRMKSLASVDEMLGHAITEGWIEPDGDRFRPGRSQPS